MSDLEDIQVCFMGCVNRVGGVGVLCAAGSSHCVVSLENQQILKEQQPTKRTTREESYHIFNFENYLKKISFLTTMLP